MLKDINDVDFIGFDNSDDVSEYIGFTTRGQLLVHYRDRLGLWYESTFENAPYWKYWNNLDENTKKMIIRKISH
jgi:hypothetical protein